MPVTFKKPYKRKPGQRAGLSREKIAAAALDLWTKHGAEGFSIRAVAAKLKTGPTAVRNHFKGGAGELQKEVARRALANLSPPYKPDQSPKAYLRGFLHASLLWFQEQPVLARLVALELASDPLLSLVLAERIGATLMALGGADLVQALERFIERWAALALIETGAWARADPEQVKTTVQNVAAGLESAEFPTLAQTLAKPSAALAKRAKVGYLAHLADATCAAIVTDLAADAT
jgi:AcrR family transcriptional regulator